MLSIAFLIIVVVDPFGNIPMVNSLVSQAKVEDRQKILLRESLFASLILLLSALVGQTLLDALSLTSHSLSISGGIVLFVIALGMLFPKNKMLDDEVEADPFIFPIAMPLIAGPSAISAVILSAQKHPLFSVCAGVTIACLFSTIILVFSPLLINFLGRRGLIAIERLMGMLLILISVQMILDGIQTYIQELSPVEANET